MRYIDSGIREAEQTVGFWMKSAVESKIREFRCQAGYFTLDGSSLLLPLLKRCAAEGAIVRLLLGSNGGATLASHIAFLAGTLGIPQNHVSLGVISFDNCLFHPKVYHFVREDGSQTAYVGSANLTESGIAGRNVEAGVILDSSGGDDIEVLREIERRIEAWFEDRPIGLSHITKHADIDELLASVYLALAPKPRAREIEEEGEDAAAKPSRPHATLKSIFQLPTIEEKKKATSEEPEALTPLSAPEKRRFVRRTEASFHYPQGTHLGHILTILAHFSGDRAGTAFDNKFIRLEGSLGTGRIAAYRRQIKYKMLAAIELGLVTDIRLVDDTISYEPALTEAGRKL
jgi:HKD family nuclease